METLNVEYIIKGLALYFPHVNSLSKQKHAMRRGTRKRCGLKVRHYAARLIELNDYLSSLPGDNLSDKVGIIELKY